MGLPWTSKKRWQCLPPLSANASWLRGFPHVGRRVTKSSTCSNPVVRRHGMKAIGAKARSKQEGPSQPPWVPTTQLLWRALPWDPQPRACPQQAHTRLPQREGHTSVRTDDDSGLDTLWLLKKMDSRSEKANTERSGLVAERDGDSNARHQGAAPSQLPVTVAARAFSLSVQQPPPGAPESRAPPTLRRHYTTHRHTPIQGSCFKFSSHM